MARDVPVCMRCGNRDIRPQTIRDGLWPGGGESMAWWTCDRCGHLGPPFLMDPADAPAPEGDARWDAEAAEPTPAEPVTVRPPRRGFGILLLVVSAALLVPLVLVLANREAWRSVGAFAGALSVAGMSLLFSYWVGRVGWRNLRPTPEPE